MIQTSFDRFTLFNGLRVVVVPDDTTPMVSVSVHYDVGSRSEPEDRSGFAHLFEHLMFGGSESAPKHEHPRRVKATGGILNGTTTPDYTVYYNIVPAEALETVLFLEADRMRAPLLDETELRKQIAVVKEEVRGKVLSLPYGRFPLQLSSVLYQTFPNTHDGWGDFDSLTKATPDDCAAFFDTHYSPNNAVLTITGAVTTSRAVQIVLRHFDDIPSRVVPPRPDFDEPVPTSTRRRDEFDPRVPLMAVAVGHRLPHPTTQIDDYLAHLVLADVLCAGDSSRLRQRLVHDDALASTVAADPMHRPFVSRHPDTLGISVYAAPAVTVEQIVAVLDEELDRLARHPPAVEEIRTSIMRRTTSIYAQCNDPVGRAKQCGMFELLHGDAELLPRMPQRLAAVTPEIVAAAARTLRPDNRAVFTLIPSGDQA